MANPAQEFCFSFPFTNCALLNLVRVLATYCSIKNYPKTEKLKTTNNFCGSEIQEHLSWMALAESLPKISAKLLTEAAVISRLAWN